MEHFVNIHFMIFFVIMLTQNKMIRSFIVDEYKLVWETISNGIFILFDFQIDSNICLKIAKLNR